MVGLSVGNNTQPLLPFALLVAGPLSLAAAHQGSLVVVSGQTLYSFDLTVASGLQQPQGQCQLLQQASSLDLLQVPCSHPAEPGSGLPGGDALSDAQAAAQDSAGAHQLLVAAGLWVENRVVLLSWPHLEEVGEVDLEGQQPRSSSLLMVAGRPVLVVGTATGQVCAQRGSTGADGWSRVGNMSACISPAACCGLQQCCILQELREQGKWVQSSHLYTGRGRSLVNCSCCRTCTYTQRQQRHFRFHKDQQALTCLLVWACCCRCCCGSWSLTGNRPRRPAVAAGCSGTGVCAMGGVSW